ncbi:MAG: hypothetical protein BIFFINMI_04392 [Phycisphaerae bacterium]|nr:hypothetical protein [Phycisphaerae bacterium]
MRSRRALLLLTAVSLLAVAACDPLRTQFSSPAGSAGPVVAPADDLPIGDPSRDDAEGNGVIDCTGEKAREAPSPLADLAHATWYVTSGGAGAPYCSRQMTPWNRYWSGRDAAEKPATARFIYSSQENVILFRAEGDRMSLEVVNPHGERIDFIADLMAARRTATPARP